MDGSLWPPRYEDRSEDTPRFKSSSPRGALIAVVTAGAVFAALLVLIAPYGPAYAGMIGCAEPTRRPGALIGMATLIAWFSSPGTSGWMQLRKR
jgi:hypothetical protein